MIVRTLPHREESVAQSIVEIQRAAYLVESAIIRYEIPSVHATLDDIVSSRETFLGCEIEGQLAGVTSYDDAQPDVEVCRLVVAPAYFRRGAGAALVQAVVSTFGASRAIYVSTGADNGPAIRLYENLGFSIALRRTLDDGLRLVSLRREAQ